LTRTAYEHIRINIITGWRKWILTVPLWAFFLALVAGWLLGWKLWIALIAVGYVATGIGHYFCHQGATFYETGAKAGTDNLFLSLVLAPPVALLVSLQALFRGSNPPNQETGER
jgi:hypothetical protein